MQQILVKLFEINLISILSKAMRLIVILKNLSIESNNETHRVLLINIRLITEKFISEIQEVLDEYYNNRVSK